MEKTYYWGRKELPFDIICYAYYYLLVIESLHFTIALYLEKN